MNPIFFSEPFLFGISSLIGFVMAMSIIWVAKLVHAVVIRLFDV